MTEESSELVPPHALTEGDVAGVDALMRSLGWLGGGETVVSADSAGEGNMNLTLRVATKKRTMVLKQARPWVEKYPQIPAPVERSQVEATFYQQAALVPGVAKRMPQLLAADEQSNTLLLQDLGAGCRDFTYLYSRDSMPIEDDCLKELARFLTLLHGARIEGAEATEVLANSAMRVLNHEHIFVVPYTPDNGVVHDELEPGLGETAAKLREDEPFLSIVERLGERYLETGDTLVHGDYFPGSWLESDPFDARGDDDPNRGCGDIYIIDPEFCFFGDPEFDVGVALAHLVLSEQPKESAIFWLDTTFAQASGGLDASLVAGFAGVEIVRRVLGVAQLPIPASAGGSSSSLRSDLVTRGAEAVRSGSLRSLLF